MNAHNRPNNPSDPVSDADPAKAASSNVWGDSEPDSIDAADSKGGRDAKGDPYSRPMSERQRRRLAEQQRLAEQRTAQAEKQTAGFLSPMAESADAPPAIATDTAPTVTATKTKTKSAKARSNGPSAKPAYILATLAAALWVGGIGSFVAYEYGSGMIDLDPVRLAVYVMIALAPVGLFYLLAHMARLGSSLAVENRRARELADAMIAPTAYASQEAGNILSTLRADIEGTNQIAERARAELTALREALATESTRLGDAARTAQASTQSVTLQLGREREQLAELGQSLTGQANQVSDAVNRQAQMVADASDLAQALLREAEAGLAARAADLAAAASEAQDAARVAAEDLSRETMRLESAGGGVTQQIKAVEDGLSQQRASLATAAYALRTDQEDFAAQIEGQRAQFIEHLSQTRATAHDLSLTGDHIAEGIKTQVEAVLEQFRSLVAMSQREADGFDAATKMSLDSFENLAAQSRERLLDETRRAIDALHAASIDQRELAEQALQQAQIRADRLGESLFDAARQADDAAEARITGARRIVTETLNLVDQTGAEATSRLETLTHRMTDALARIEASVREMDERAARMPQEAAQRIADVRTTVEQGLASLTDASRRAAADTEALDVGFQDRVRRNYEMLTEAVRLLDNGDAVTPSTKAPHQPQPQPSPATTTLAGNTVFSAPAPAREPVTPPRFEGPRPELSTQTAPAAPAPQPAAAAQPDSIADSVLSWKDVAPPAPQATAAPREPILSLEDLCERATAAIRRMGVDPNALLPRARVEDVALSLSRQDALRARQIVRRVAPAAVRSVARRITADPAVQAEIESFIGLYAQMIASIGADQDSVQMRLATDEGRAFMLFDAALGDAA